MNKKKNEDYLDWLHKLRKSKSKLPLTERLSKTIDLRDVSKRQLKKVA